MTWSLRLCIEDDNGLVVCNYYDIRPAPSLEQQILLLRKDAIFTLGKILT